MLNLSINIPSLPSPPYQVHAFLEPPLEGVVLETYGSGNGPDSREELLEELRAASKRGVIIVNCTQCLYGHVVDSYATGRVGIFVFILNFLHNYSDQNVISA